ncbi:unnamed protein product [Cyprideis torosa]|uniref:Uncharacterized protein n=1 Tax=Cyprideis torosa TaxID=163714 RepID=A0A7R8WGH3_9CRUS|nr:unnamed protein product [Cyprideis torosa]CAG0898175.1 unnamed protein product [Cyprideis torosa]
MNRYVFFLLFELVCVISAQQQNIKQMAAETLSELKRLFADQKGWTEVQNFDGIKLEERFEPKYQRIIRRLTAEQPDVPVARVVSVLLYKPEEQQKFHKSIDFFNVVKAEQPDVPVARVVSVLLYKPEEQQKFHKSIDFFNVVKKIDNRIRITHGQITPKTSTGGLLETRDDVTLQAWDYDANTGSFYVGYQSVENNIPIPQGAKRVHSDPTGFRITRLNGGKGTHLMWLANIDVRVPENIPPQVFEIFARANMIEYVNNLFQYIRSSRT